ncbi:MAG: winged helix-turn-helix domain-containing protein [Rhodobacteraceae bacterium]|nr:winged helix-turn-helix domain-containing protein [Paracoccaceae bacterium]
MEKPGILLLGSSRRSQALAELLTDCGEFSIHVAGDTGAARKAISTNEFAACIACEEWTKTWFAQEAPAHIQCLELVENPSHRSVLQSQSVHAEFMTCPFALKDLLTVLRSLLRRFELESGRRFQIGTRLVDPATMRVEDESGKRFRLTRMELRLLNELRRRAGTTVSRASLLERVWGYNERIVTSTLDTHIYSLRQKVEIDPHNPMHVVSDNGGYRLITDAGAR